jgi:hypothetical protein
MSEQSLECEFEMDKKPIWELEDIYQEVRSELRRLEKYLDEQDPEDRGNISGLLKSIRYNEALLDALDDHIERRFAPKNDSPQALKFSELEKRIRDLQNTEKQDDLLDCRIEWIRRKKKLYLETPEGLKKLLEQSQKDIDLIYLDRDQLAKDTETFGKEAIDAYIEKETLFQAAIELELSLRG